MTPYEDVQRRNPGITPLGAGRGGQLLSGDNGVRRGSMGGIQGVGESVLVSMWGVNGVVFRGMGDSILALTPSTLQGGWGTGSRGGKRGRRAPAL